MVKIRYQIKKLKGTLTQVRLIDASFIWTEPHSRRIKIKLVVQKEIQEGAILEQTVPVSYPTLHSGLTGRHFQMNYFRLSLSFKELSVQIVKELKQKIIGSLLFRFASRSSTSEHFYTSNKVKTRFILYFKYNIEISAQ